MKLDFSSYPLSVYNQSASKSLLNSIGREVSMEEARVNLMSTSCVTDHLPSLESGSWGNGAKNIGKAVLDLLNFKNPLETIWESVVEVSRKYEDICQVYHIAFLLNVYNSNPSTENVIRRLIANRYVMILMENLHFLRKSARSYFPILCIILWKRF